MFAVLTVVVTVSLYSQNPPAPPPQPTPAPTPPPAAPDTSRRARARTELPRPQKPINTNATVITGEGITLDSTLLAGFRWRAIGPANMGGRVSSVTGIPSPSKTFFVAAAAGGIWKTTNAGTTFRPVFDNEKCVSMGELAIAPSDTTQVWAGTGEEDSRNTISPGCGIFKSTDGGLTWKLVGLEKAGAIGRIAVPPTKPNTVYVAALGQTWSPTPERGLCRSTDGGTKCEKMNGNDVRPFYYSQVRVDPKDANRVYWSSTPVNYSNDGGKTIGNATVGIHVDHHSMWIDPNDANHIVVGNDGGVAQTWDKGGNWDFLNTFPIGQPYIVSYDMAFPYNVCAGFQDDGSWCGPSRRRQGEITNADWTTVGGGDGFYTAQDPNDPTTIYVESQGGNMSRLNFSSGERVNLQKPNWRPRYTQYEDSIVIERPDTTRPETAAQRRRIAELRVRQRTDSADIDLRWNWNTPFFISAHSPETFYAGANKVMKSTRRGEDLYPISPDLSTKDTMKIRVSTKTTGGVTPDVTGAETHCTIVSLAESPLRPGLLFAGTDDGNTWLTKNDGGSWESLTGRFPGVPPGTYVSRIEPSHFDTATFYVTFDNHRNGDYTPYVYITTNFGKSFRSLVSNLPNGGVDYVHVIREDPSNKDLPFA